MQRKVEHDLGIKLIFMTKFDNENGFRAMSWRNEYSEYWCFLCWKRNSPAPMMSWPCLSMHWLLKSPVHQQLNRHGISCAEQPACIAVPAEWWRLKGETWKTHMHPAKPVRNLDFCCCFCCCCFVIVYSRCRNTSIESKWTLSKYRVCPCLPSITFYG